jgi:hypothetical protein
MSDPSIVKTLQGRATGIIFFASFGGLWMALSLLVGARLDWTSGTLIGLAWLALIATTIWMLRRVGNAGTTPGPETEEDLRERRLFRTVNLMQWGAVALAVPTLIALHRESYVLTAIAIIVGIHLYPLARAFRYLPHYVTGTALVAWAAFIAFSTPPAEVAFLTGLGTGLILWTSAALTLVYCLVVVLQRLPRLTTP